MNITTTVVGNTLKFAFDSSADSATTMVAEVVKTSALESAKAFASEHPVIATVGLGLVAVGTFDLVRRAVNAFKSDEKVAPALTK